MRNTMVVKRYYRQLFQVIRMMMYLVFGNVGKTFTAPDEPNLNFPYAMASSSQSDPDLQSSPRNLVVCLDAEGVDISQPSTLIRLYSLLERSSSGQLVYYTVHPIRTASGLYLLST
jgi:hypothetical protein